MANESTMDAKFSIKPHTCANAEECIELKIAGAHEAVLYLTPQQARALASDLIQTVYRAEVKNSLQGKPRSPIEAQAIAGAPNNFSLHTPHAA